MVQKLSKIFVVFSLALSFGLSMFSFTPAASVSTHAAYGGDIPCDQFKTVAKRQKCLEKIQDKLEKQKQKALDKKLYEKYNELLSQANNIYWELWNLSHFGNDYF